jgi:homoserine O-succinyltransferase
MPLLLDTAQSGSAVAADGSHCVTVGLVNNMPDAALAATERQFVDLIGASARNVAVRLLLFAIPEVPRANAARGEMAGRYREVAELWDSHVDGLIVTGTEPRAANLKDEPYWGALTRLVEWAHQHTSSTIWSCLAAHAAVLHTDGVERRAFPEKLSGVFECEPAAAHPMVRGADLPLRVPHSRCNDLPEQGLKSCGYRILTRSAAAGVDMFVRHGRSLQFFLQGHPEYDAGTLLREYRRDVGRYLRGERDLYPATPRGYFDDATMAKLEAFRARARAERRGDLIGDFPARALETGLDSPWRATAVAIYENWFDYLKGRKADRRPVLTPMRRAWRDWPGGRRRVVADNSAI